MDNTLKNLTVEERIRIVEDLWDSIASDQKILPLTEDQIAELDRRLEAFEVDRDPGRTASDVISDIRKRL
jgi:putative addiction module component (TIGR02574 family)